MFHLTLTPIRMQGPLAVAVRGDTLILNGEDFDFGPLPEGAVLPRAAVASDWLASDVTRRAGVLHLSLMLPHGADAPLDTRYPIPILVTRDGTVTMPAWGPSSAAEATL